MKKKRGSHQLLTWYYRFVSSRNVAQPRPQHEGPMALTRLPKDTYRAPARESTVVGHSRAVLPQGGRLSVCVQPPVVYMAVSSAVTAAANLTCYNHLICICNSICAAQILHHRMRRVSRDIDHGSFQAHEVSPPLDHLVGITAAWHADNVKHSLPYVDFYPFISLISPSVYSARGTESVALSPRSTLSKYLPHQEVARTAGSVESWNGMRSGRTGGQGRQCW